MAKTLSQAGGQTDGGVLPVSTSISSAQQVRPAEYRAAGDTLSKDLLGILGKSSEIVQQSNTLSVKAAERVASDSLTEMSKEILAIEAQRTDATDPREEARAIEVIYQQYGRKTFDNEDAQLAFDNSYHRTGALTVAQKSAALNRDALKKDAEFVFNKTNTNLETQLNAGILFTNDMLKQNQDAMTNNNFYSAEDAQFAMADRSTTSFQSKVFANPKQVLDSVGFDANVGYTTEVATSLFNREFGAYGELIDGTIVWKKDIGNKAQEEILRAWSTFDSGMKDDKGEIIDPYKRIGKVVSDSTSNASSNYVPSVILKKELQSANNDVIAINNTKPSTGNQLDNMVIKLEELENEITKTQMIEIDLGVGADLDSNQAVGYLYDGKVAKTYDSRLKKFREEKIPAIKYQTAAKSFIETSSKEALSMKLTDSNNVQAFQQNVTKVLELEGVTNMTSTLTKKYGDYFEPAKVSGIQSINETQQLIAYNDVIMGWDKNNVVLEANNEKLKDILNNTELTDMQKKFQINIAVKSFRSNATSEMQNGYVRNLIRTKVNEQREGNGILTNEADINVATEHSIMKAIYYQNKQDNAEAYVDEIMSSRTYDAGSLMLGDKDTRVVMPSNGTSKRMSNAIRAVIRNTTKTTFKEHDFSDIILKNDFKNGDYTVTIFSKKLNKDIGTIHKDNIYGLAYKGEE